ncbi:phosphoadenosine phosphosulfate reductase, partial [Streptomyces mirabilis]
MPYCWTYDSVPGAGEWAGTSRCSCSLCVFASRTDVLLSVGRRPRLADLYSEVEQVRGDSFRADWRITDLIRHANTCGAPDPGVVCPDDGPEFTALQEQVRETLKKDPPQGTRDGPAQRARPVRRLHRPQLIAACAGPGPDATPPPH